ncbi:MAG: ABC transporter substrate-binding protein [Hyphomicrobiales bacterium]|nr:MAG: ABC transporter substrate-binding protein [Hyphomicrobiales bacterium]
MFDNKKSGRLHPKVREAEGLMNAGRMDRREFIRIAALLGVSAGAAYGMAGLPSPAFAADGTMPFPADEAGAKMGGILKVGMEIQKMEDPATYSWVEMSNQTRHMLEHLAMTGPDNVTRPMLAEKWEASDDLKTWTFYLRKGVKWNNGDDFTADDIIFNFTRWLDPTLGSSNVGLSTCSAMVEEVETGEKDDKGNPKKVKKMIAGAIEKVDDHTVRLNLSKPVLSVPEDMYNYPTAIVHSSFKPPLSDNPIGTGPFKLAELAVGEKCILKRVTDVEYWGGKVYLDEIHYYNFSDDNALTAFAGGDVDTIYEFGIEQYELAKAFDGNIIEARTAQNLCCRMQVDKAPFDDPRIRKAVTMACDNSVVRDLVFQGGGDIGENHHVAPVHPEYFALPALKRDIEGAKKLLAEAGHPDGIELTIDVGNTDGPWHQTVVEIMRDQMKDAGITLNINVLPSSKFWEIWDKTPFGAVAWTHRPLGTMVLSLGYRTGVPWNDCHLADPAFDAALDDAEATLDVEERRKKMEKVEKILQDHNVMVMPIWRPLFSIAAKKVKGIKLHPTNYHQFNKVWLDA